MLWIKIKEALPEVGEWCIIRTDSNVYRVARFGKVGHSPLVFCAARHDIYDIDEVTHWARFEPVKSEEL